MNKNFIKFTIFIFLALILSQRAHAASMYVVSGQQTVYEGDIVMVDWYVDTAGQDFNVVNATLMYSSDQLSVDSISTGSSSVSLWAEGPTMVKPGAISLSGGIPGGISGHKVLILKTLIKANKPGNALLTIDSHSKILKSDGSGTEIPLSMQPLYFSVLPIASKSSLIYSSTHKDQSKWYKNNNPIFLIKNYKDNYTYSFSANPEITPVETLTPDKLSYSNLTDGVYYLKLGMVDSGKTREVATYRVMIDRTAPEIMSASVEKSPDIFSNHSFLNFYAVDKMSGVGTKKVKVGWFGFYHNASSPYKLSRPVFGNYIKLKVSDMAGNTIVEKVYYKGYLSNTVGVIIILVICFVIFYLSLWKRRILKS